MAAGFDGQGAVDPGFVETHRFIDHIAVAPLEAVMHTAPFHDEPGQTGRSNGVRHDGGTGLLIQQDGGNKGDEPVAVDFPAGCIHNGSTVTVGIKDDTQVCTDLHHSIAEGLHGFGIFGIGDMIGETAIGFQELTAFYPGTQFFHQLRIEAAGAVTGIHHHMQAQQGLLHIGVQALLNPGFQLVAVHGQKFPLLDGITAAHQGIVAFGNGENFIQIMAGDTALLGEKLEAVAVRGMVAGGHHHSTVAFKAFGDQAHIHGRSGAHAVAFHAGTGQAAAFGTAIQQHFARQPAVPTQGNAGVIHTSLAQPADKSPADPAGYFCRQRRSITQCFSPHIRAAFECAKVCHTFPPVSSSNWFSASSTQPCSILYTGISISKSRYTLSAIFFCSASATRVPLRLM